MTTIALPWATPPLTQNALRRMHHHAEAKAKAKALAEARCAVKTARPAFMPGAIVILNWQMPDHRRRDGDGAAPTLKVCLDALVAEGVLHDDSWQFVPHSGITCHAPIAGCPGSLWLSVAAIETTEVRHATQG